MGSKSPAARNVLRVLSLLASVDVPMSASRIRAELDLPRSTTYQLLGELEAEGYVVALRDTQTYGLGWSAYAMADAYTTQQPLVRLGRRAIDAIAQDAEGSGHISRLSGSEVIYLYEYRSPRALSLITEVGVRLLAVQTASGRAMLSWTGTAELKAVLNSVGRSDSVPSLRAMADVLKRDRERGFSLEVEEVSPGQQTVAVPVLDHLGRPAAALAVTLPVAGVGMERCQQVARRLASASNDLSQRLYGRQPGDADPVA